MVGGWGDMIGEGFGACGELGIGKSAQYEFLAPSLQQAHVMLEQLICIVTEGKGIHNDIGTVPIN